MKKILILTFIISFITGCEQEPIDREMVNKANEVCDWTQIVVAEHWVNRPPPSERIKLEIICADGNMVTTRILRN